MLELNQGTQLADRYTLVRRLGGDRDTHTWLAKDRLTKASIALKITSGDSQNSAQLHDEWQASIRLMHAHIVRVFEFHAEDDAAFFSQQFIDGPDIGVLAGTAVGDILGPMGLLLRALSYVHGKGLVHRDIKASNVLIDANGAPYLSDFGVACAAGEMGSGGSPIAQSPQSLRGEPASPTDDIFALGSLLYELIAGKPPWAMSDLANEIKSADVPPLMAIDGTELPESVVAIVAEMLDKDASHRPTADAIAQRLGAAGFTAKTANVRGVATGVEDELVIESVASIRPVSRPSTETSQAVAEAATGIRPKTVGIAFGVLVLVLVAVIFVLPKNVSEKADRVVVDIVDTGGTTVSEFDSQGRVRPKVYVDSEVRQRIRRTANAPIERRADDAALSFSTNSADLSGMNEEARARFNAELTLGELLSALEILESRGIERWAVREHRSAREMYKSGDEAYLEKDFAYAEELYLGALTVLDPLYDKIEPTFQKAYSDAVFAFEAGDRLGALSAYELAVAITPNHPEAAAGYERTRNLEAVLRLVDQGVEYEEDLELDSAQSSFEKAIEMDGLWQPAQDGLLRVQATRTKIEFDSRMSEGFEAIAYGEFLAARAAFRVAERLIPGSSETADGLLQVEQGLRLQEISTLEREAQALERDEHWDAVVKTYEELIKVDGTLSFARDGLARGREMSALHAKLETLISEPDKLSVPRVMQEATMLIVNITTRQEVGSRLGEQRDELSRLLKRAATAITVPIVSDNVTQVTIYKVGRLGNFMRKEVTLRPGTYVAVGSRPGYRDVRQEFRVAPENDMQPVIVQCEEPI
jgi:tetratricopeptide (TPR) repeat protein